MHQITKSKNLNDLNGVTLTTPANGEVLTYDSTAQEWVNSPNISLKRLEIQANINDTDLDYSADISSTKFTNAKYYDTATSSDLTVSDFVAEMAKGRMVYLKLGTISSSTTKVLYTPIVYTDLIGSNSLTRTISVINRIGNVAYAGHYEISFAGTPSISYIYDGTVPTSLDDLSDVDLSNPADGQVIKYDATLGKWINAAGGGGASYKILTDTLEAGHTSITFTDADILADSIVSCATPAGINPTAMTSTTGSVTFYFQSQAIDITVKAVIF